MALQFTSRPLYGGTITADLPNDIIDASDLRQVPDHQEVFLRPKTLTSIIFEINEYQSVEAVSSTVEVQTSISSEHTAIPPQDAAAATHHLNDVIQPPDHLSEAGIETKAIKLPQSSLANFPAYLSIATVITPEIDRSAASTSTLPVSWQSNPARTNQQEKFQLLLVRMQQAGTDLCVRVNVPLKEFDGPQSEAALTELASADQIMAKIVETLDVKDFGLFVGGE